MYTELHMVCMWIGGFLVGFGTSMIFYSILKIKYDKGKTDDKP